MRIAILGTGSVATALGAGFTAAGHDIVFGSRSPEAATLSHTDAVTDADVIVTAVPGQTVVPMLEAIGDEALAGRVILDVSNAFTEQFTLAYPNDSVGRLIQARFPNAHVVKSLSTMNVSVMTNPTAAPGTTVFLSGDNDDAKSIVRSLLTDLGWPTDSALDLGGIASAAGAEHYGLLFIGILTALQNPTFNIAVIH